MQDVANVAVSVKSLYYEYRPASGTSSFSSNNVLDNISFSVNEGDLLGVIGPNGAGKTTLFSCMLGLLKDYLGEIRIFGYDVRKNSRVLQDIGYIPQQKSIDQGFPATVQEIVSLGMIGKKNSSKEEMVASALKMVDLSGQDRTRIGELSGGQQQRVLIAKALVNEPKLLILDEPTTSVDVETQNKFYAMVKALNQKSKITIIWASHDLDAVNRIANKVMCLNRTMFFHGDAHEFFESDELIRLYSESSMQLHMHSHSNQNKNFGSKLIEKT